MNLEIAIVHVNYPKAVAAAAEFRRLGIELDPVGCGGATMGRRFTTIFVMPGCKETPNWNEWANECLCTRLTPEGRMVFL